MNDFDKEVDCELDRIDVVGDTDARSTRSTHRGCIELESSGLALIGGRTASTRRPVLARLILDTLGRKEGGEISNVVVFANGTERVLTREIISMASQIDFAELDNVELSNESYQKLVCGINRLIEIEALADDSAGPVESNKDVLHWCSGPVSADLITKAIVDASPGTVVIVENAHLIETGKDITVTLAELRNSAARAKVFLYAGCGVSHWPSVRKSSKLELSDLDEAFSSAVHIADKIALLHFEDDELRVSIFDTRQAKPWRGIFDPKNPLQQPG